MRGYWIASAVVAMTLAVTLAGCTTEEETPTANDGDGDPLPPTSTDETKGTVEGVVVSEESAPLAGASVAILPGTLQMTTGEDGRFRFTNLEPGVYDVVAGKIGFESRGMKATVVAGEVFEVTLQLTQLEVVVAYHETFSFRGHLQCTLSVYVWVSPCDYPYTAVYYTAHGLGVNLSEYGVPAEPLENVWRWNTEVQNGSKGTVSELTWEPTSAASNTMMIITSCPEYDPVIDDCPGWSRIADGPAPVVRLEWDMPDDETVFMTRVYLPWEQVQLALDQKYDVYQTFFWGEDPPKNFSALPSS